LKGDNPQILVAGQFVGYFFGQAIGTLICCWNWNRKSGNTWKIQPLSARAPGKTKADRAR